MPSQRPDKRCRLKLDLAYKQLCDEKSPLTDAPAEVRMRIFKYLFEGTRMTIDDRYGRRGVRVSKATHRRVGILLACKALRLEAQHMLAHSAKMVLALSYVDWSGLLSFRDVYFPYLQYLCLPDPADMANFRPSMFPNLKCLECSKSITDTDSGPFEIWGGCFEEKELPLLATHVVSLDRDEKLADEWMDGCDGMADRLFAADNSASSSDEAREESIADALRSWRQLIRSKERKFRITTKVDFEILLVHDVELGGPCMCLLLVMSNNL